MSEQFKTRNNGYFRKVRIKMTKWLPCKHGDLKCPLYQFCLARMNDPTICGCGMPLYQAGKIEYKDIEVCHEIVKEQTNGSN